MWPATPFSLSMASVVIATTLADDAGNIDFYQLRVSAEKEASLDGRFLGLEEDIVGIYQHASPITVYTVVSPPSPSVSPPAWSSSSQPGLISLHIYPIGTVDHALGLVTDEEGGGVGGTVFKSIANPAGGGGGGGGGGSPTADVNSFTLNVSSGILSYAGSVGGWVAYPAPNPGDYQVNWLAEGTMTIEDYLPIEIIAVLVPEPSLSLSAGEQSGIQVI